MRADGDTLALGEFLAPGVIAEDIPPLFPLLANRPLIGALIALFRGGDEEVLVRLMVLREVGLRADAPEWTPRELEAYFAFLNDTKLGTVLARLREHGLLLWDTERRVYQLSAEGRMVLAALSNLLAFNSEQDGELGFLAAQVAAGAAVGKLSPEALSHLLARLGELEEEFAQAVASGSEFRLRHAQARLASVQQWMDKANDVMRKLSAEGYQILSLSKSTRSNSLRTTSRQLNINQSKRTTTTITNLHQSFSQQLQKSSPINHNPTNRYILR